jgi:hypothetical protein
MSYVLTSNGAKAGYILERSYMGKFMAKDYIAPLRPVYGGRLPCSYALTFETVEAAQNYLNAHNGIIPDTWKICEIDPCMNAIIREVC